MTTDFTNLPPNVLLSILSHLNPKDLVRFLSTCRALYELSTTDPQIWEPPVAAQISQWGVPIHSSEVIGRPIMDLKRTAERPWRFHDTFKHHRSSEEFKFFRLEFQGFVNFEAIQLLPTARWMFFLATQASDDPSVPPGPKRIIAGDYAGETARFPATAIVPESMKTFKAEFGGSGALLYGIAELPEDFVAMFVLDFTTSPNDANNFTILGSMTVPFPIKEDYVVVGDLWAACSTDSQVVVIWDWRAGTQVFCRIELGQEEDADNPPYMPLIDVRGGVVFFWDMMEQCIVGYMPARTAQPIEGEETITFYDLMTPCDQEEPELWYLHRKPELCFPMHPTLTQFIPPPGTQCVVRTVYSTLRACEGSTHIVFVVFPTVTLRIQPLRFKKGGRDPTFFYMRSYPMKNHLIVEDGEWCKDGESVTVYRETIDDGVIAMSAKGDVLYSERVEEEGTPFLQSVLESNPAAMSKTISPFLCPVSGVIGGIGPDGEILFWQQGPY
ncbi:hypothetical protein FRB90_005992 [Tulasnella sp. 427]|nr:hypothetical protein FRB90_005992 [Tulasnella sp. 427]